MTLSSTTDKVINLDTAIIGGGVAGLWLLERLRDRGYSCALFNKGSLGAEQTLASQGMIHGGVKYTLAGALSGASEAIADMPGLWRSCLKGEGEVDLRQTRLLSDHFYMWSASAAGRLTSFFASRALRGRVEKVPPAERPPLFDTPQFSGSLYKLVDMVVDVPSLIANLAGNNKGLLFALGDHQWQRRGDKAELQLADGTRVCARHFVLAAGRGNAAVLEKLGADQPQQQLRPLRQLVVRHHHPYAFYGHCLGADKTPRLTISSHPADDGAMIWYLGGSLAEEGARMSDDALIAAGRRELAQLFPWLDFRDADFSTLYIERAEPRQPGLTRPDQAFAELAQGLDNVIVAWPTKLTLAPNMARRVMALLPAPIEAEAGIEQLQARLGTPTLAPLPWETP
ncbi:NAD(P)/FAD-dependent oxidoreductase [Gilvimarinus algae]|uniref:FAD-dependent oxidoreductase n=1 Tax=Gilvimarinus algae TaxID=3058037 RepID=A0ABT8T9R4_9GAMM|nr:FAD-dependent oxidoreductase [Gilvimarinus sp. SDUM040014]MDO3380872.1 FAD-dependent oxidoreductase [Gilvimarinus sp. SDUM040014]